MPRGFNPPLLPRRVAPGIVRFTLRASLRSLHHGARPGV